MEKKAAASTDHAVTTTIGGKGRRVQLRAARPSAFTRPKQRIFLDQLAATCNVRRAAAAAGACPTTIYQYRRHDPAFAAGWAAALDAGYEHLETLLLARAIGSDAPGGAAAIGGVDPAAVPGDAFDPAIALKLLAQRRDGRPRQPGGPARKRSSIEQVRASLLAKLAVLNKRLAVERARAGDGARAGDETVEA